MCVNPANANNIVILDRYELKFPHNASAGNEFCPCNAVTWFARNKSEFHGTTSYNYLHSFHFLRYRHRNTLGL